MEEKPSTSYDAGTTDASTLGSSVHQRKPAKLDTIIHDNENVEANAVIFGKDQVTDQQTAKDYALTLGSSVQKRKRAKQNTNVYVDGKVDANAAIFGKGNIYITLPLATDQVTEQQTAKDCDELKHLLREEARNVWKIHQLSCVKHPITIAPLQITHLKELESSEKLGHFIHRQEISKIISKPPVGDVLVKDLFIKAKECAIEFANNHFRKEESQEKASHIEIHGNIVAVIGQAGMGKTALSKIILKQIINEGLFSAEYAFLLPFREFNYAKETDLLSFLTESIPIKWRRDKSRCEAVLNALAESDKVILILDGFDEAKQDTSSATNYTVNLHSLAKPEVFIKHILSGKVFPKALKLITSRPRQLYELSSEFRPRFIVNILGLDEKAQKLICKDICGENSDEVFNNVQDHPDIAAFCYTPVNCILVMHSIHSINAQKNELSNSITGIFAVAFGLFLSTPHFRKLFILEKFSNLAWGGFKDNKYYFNESDLREAGLHGDEQNALLVTALSKNKLTFLGGDPTKFTYFSHLLFQESLVAIKLTFYTTPSEFEALFVGERELDSFQTSKPVYDLSESRFEMVAKFLFGFSNEKTLSYLQEKFPSLNVSPDHAKMLKNLALKYMPLPNTAENVYIGRALPIFDWAFEVDDEALTKRLSCQLPKNILFLGKVLPSDVGAIHNMLRERISPLNVSIPIGFDYFVGDSFKRFLVEMKQTIECSPAIKIKELSTNDHDVGDIELMAISSYCSNIDQLEIGNSNSEQRFTKTGITALTVAIQNLNKPMQSLDITQRNLEDDELITISTCLHNVEKLTIRSKLANHFTMKGITALTEAVQKLPKPMQSLDLNHFHLEDDGLIAISTCLHNVEKLTIGRILLGNRINMKGITAFTKAVQKLPKPMQSLDLNHFHLEDDELITISTCLHNVEKLAIGNIFDNRITIKGITALTEALQKLPKPMQSLDITRSKLGDDGFIAISTCLHNIEELKIGSIRDERITMKGITALTKAVQKLPKPMKSLKILCEPSLEEAAREEIKRSNVKNVMVEDGMDILSRQLEMRHKHLNIQDEYLRTELQREAEKINMLVSSTLHSYNS